MNKPLLSLLAAALCLAACNTVSIPDEPVGKTPTMGWSSWNAFMLEISDSLIMQHADLLVSSGLKDAGYGIVNIDDGYFGYRDADGNMVPHVVRFPNGMKHVVDHIHSLGLRAGIYSDAGEQTCGGDYNREINDAPVGLYGHEALDAQKFFNEWEFDFIKIDYCGGRQMGSTEEALYTNIRKVIDSVATRPVELNICRWAYPGTWAPQASDSWRISGDITPRWRSIKYIVDKNMYLSAYAGDGHYNDMDMLALGYNENPNPSPFGGEDLGLSYREEEAHFGLWCIFSSPLLLGCDIRYIPDRTMEIITNGELIAVNQDRLGLQAHVAQHEGDGYVFVKDIIHREGKVRAVALYNPSEEEIDFRVEPGELELAGPLTVRDLNRREELGTMEVLALTLPPHSAKILKVEGPERIERTLYEAEWGYCPEFSDVVKEGRKYVRRDDASGRAAAALLGGNENNCLIWKDVLVKKAGTRTLTFVTFPEADTEMTVSVNGEPFQVPVAAAGGQAVESALTVRLRKGYNTVCVSNADAPLPPIDCMLLGK